jgi:hypothetical protein
VPLVFEEELLACVGFRMSSKYIKNLILPVFEEALMGKH